jgi:hypothetical protein
VVSYFVLFAVTYVLSLVFWPTPTLALIAAILLPAAIRVGLSPLAAAMAIAIAGQGMALASDYVIGVAPELSASGAGVAADLIANRALILSWVVGAVAITITFVLHVRSGASNRVRLGARRAARQEATVMSGGGGVAVADDVTSTVGRALLTKQEPRTDDVTPPDGSDDTDADDGTPVNGAKAKLFAVVVPLAFLALVAYMLLGKLTDWVPAAESGSGAALVGGLALLLTLILTLTTGGTNRLERTGEHFVDGLVVAFRAMGVVIPVAGFVLIGISDFAGRIMLLPEDATAPGFLFDVIGSGERFIPNTPIVVMFAMLIAGMLIGLDGSGWAGLPFTGGLADALAHSSGADTATLAAIAQNGASWTGGGTLIIWSSLIAVAGFTGVPVTTLARRLFLPVVAGLILSVLVAAMIW